MAETLPLIRTYDFKIKLKLNTEPPIACGRAFNLKEFSIIKK